MQDQSPLIECVPNFSEGKNATIIAAIVAAIASVKNVKVLHVDQGAAANRTVVTFAGEPEAIVEAAFLGIEKAAELIDMRHQIGIHPRIGATDVCPLIPIRGISLEEVTLLAQKLGERVNQALGIPVYLYEASATASHRKNLATIRKGEYEGLKQKIQHPKWQPDFGKTFNAKTGATVIGARNFLIAYNVNLNTKSTAIANEIAGTIRESGKKIKEGDQLMSVPGKCKSLKAIGWYVEEYDLAQVSMNLTNYKITGLHHAFEACKAAAKRLGVKVTGSELIGLVPLEAMVEAGKYYVEQEELSHDEYASIATEHLKLNDLSDFSYSQRIIEYLLERGTMTEV